MRIGRVAFEQPFVFATGVAALIHSTWSLGTLFAGSEPEQFTLAWLAWLAPALLISFSLDIGQIVTSAEIRAGQRSVAKYLTFLVLATATYFLQWLYIAHHMPELALAGGVRDEWRGFAGLLRDGAIWFIPALLPLSTTLYTFSHTKPSVVEPSRTVTADVTESALVPVVTQEKHAARCEMCDWHGEYNTVSGAEMALRAHRRHCTGVQVLVPEEQ